PQQATKSTLTGTPKATKPKKRNFANKTSSSSNTIARTTPNSTTLAMTIPTTQRL
ncbi:15306_t:CDS:2, partial [Gigaspora rosea]